ncbi:unnamed protein product [Caenorhabditis bovis]|uniref:Uncharacterized protein n=1 Tax=Caenorhabditis bovis TaxID=2654633 RepID=A0A8S1F6X5_9PELO|nr:unnamed protein product [Caenorhabditis bovis]
MCGNQLDKRAANGANVHWKYASERNITSSLDLSKMHGARQTIRNRIDEIRQDDHKMHTENFGIADDSIWEEAKQDEMKNRGVGFMKPKPFLTDPLLVEDLNVEKREIATNQVEIGEMCDDFGVTDSDTREVEEDVHLVVVKLIEMGLSKEMRRDVYWIIDRMRKNQSITCSYLETTFLKWTKVKVDTYPLCSNCNDQYDGKKCRKPNCSEQDFHNMIKGRAEDEAYLLGTLNFDGFKKDGLFRGECWPVFLSIHGYGTARFADYHSKTVVFLRHDFYGLEEKFRLKIDIGVGKKTKIFLELFSCCLDMDASRRVFNLPAWNKHQGCGRCDVNGIMIDKTMRWLPNGQENHYNLGYLPREYNKCALPMVFNHAYDYLHLFSEGVNKDRLKDLFSDQSKIRNLRQKGEVIEALTKSLLSTRMPTSNKPKLQSIADLLKITGRESDEIFFIVAPLIVATNDEMSKERLLLLLNWLIARCLMDLDLKIESISELQKLAKLLRSLINNEFKQCGTMKMHVILDHLIPDLRRCGSPVLSGTAMFERLNQLLSRSVSIIQLPRQNLCLKGYWLYKNVSDFWNKSDLKVLKKSQRESIKHRISN